MKGYPRCYDQISSVAGEPGYERWLGFVERGIVPTVYVDGRRVPLAQSADPLRGVAVTLMKDELGRVRARPGTMIGQPRMMAVTRKIHGYVRIDLVPREDFQGDSPG